MQVSMGEDVCMNLTGEKINEALWHLPVKDGHFVISSHFFWTLSITLLNLLWI